MPELLKRVIFGRSETLVPYYFHPLITSHQHSLRRKEDKFPKPIGSQLNRRFKFYYQRRFYDRIFNTTTSQRNIAAGRKMMNEPEARQLAQLIIRAAEAGDLANIKAGKDRSRPLQLLGSHIGILRREQGKSLAEIADKADIDEALLLAIELGLASPKQVYNNLRTLGDALGDRYTELSRLLIRATLKM